MTNLKILKLMIIIFMSVSLISCSTKDDNVKIKVNLNAEAKTLSNLVEKFQLTNQENRVRSDGIDRDYIELNGNINELNIFAGVKTDITILYNSNFKTGSVRVVLIKPNGAVNDIVKGNGQGSITVKVPIGRSYIKLIGSKATGTLKINIPAVTNDDLKMFGNFKNDGEYVFYNNCAIKGENLSVRFFRVNVVNKKVDKIAKIELKGKIQDGKVVDTFDNDGWDNSGTAEVFIQPNSNIVESITIKIQNKSSQSTQWGIKEGPTYFAKDGKLPDFLNGL